MTPKIQAERLLNDVIECGTDPLETCMLLVSYLKHISQDIDDYGDTWEYWNEVGRILKYKAYELRSSDNRRDS